MTNVPSVDYPRAAETVHAEAIGGRVRGARPEVARRARLEALLRVSRRLAARGDRDEVMEALVEEAVQIVDGVHGGVFLWDEAQGGLVPAWNTISSADEYTIIRLGQGASGRAAERRAAVILNDYQRESGNETPAGKVGVRAAVAVPLLYEGRLLGSLSVNSHQAGRFRPQDAEILELLAGAAAAALVGFERAALRGVTLAARELAHLLNNELSVPIGCLELLRLSPDLPPGLRPWLDEIERALDAATGHIRQLQRMVRLETKETPVGPAIDLRRSVS